jgi:hypothetical protein
MVAASSAGLSGVRNSWLSIARKLSLALLAASAASLARSALTLAEISSLSARTRSVMSLNRMATLRLSAPPTR